jgi:hypothetical protein
MGALRLIFQVNVLVAISFASVSDMVPNGRALASSADTHVKSLSMGKTEPGNCAPNAWVDYKFEVTEAMAETNLIFEVEDKGDSYNPQALMVAIWEDGVPSDRAAEHRTEYAAGKVWAVGMNNECFVVGTITLGVRCSAAAAVNFEVKVVVVEAKVVVGTSLEGEVCPGEWVYHYVNTTELANSHYGAGRHLRYILSKKADEGGGIALSRHLAAPLKTVPPYVSFEYSTEPVNGSIELCNVEEGRQYLGIRGVTTNEGGCMHYTLEAVAFTGPCEELVHQPSDDPAAVADKTLPVEHFERASCGPHQWFDFYFPVTPHMVDVEDNIVFEVEVLADQFELGGVSIHLYQGAIPLDRATELVSDTPDNGIYSIAIPSIELQAGSYYLSVKCGANPQRFRVVAFEVRGKLTGPYDAVHGEICPHEWLYHSLVPTFSDADEADVSHRRRRLGRSHRRLAGSGGVTEISTGSHLQLTFNKHAGDFIFMTMEGAHPPTRIQPPSRTMHSYDQLDYAIFCDVKPGNRYWVALYGGGHCATYDLSASLLPADDARCATGAYSLVPNEAQSTGMTEIVKERPMYGSCTPGEYVDYFLPLTYAADSDENLRFQVQLMEGGASRPQAVALFLYQDDELPTNRRTEIFADHSVDGVYSVTVNAADLKHQLCVKTDHAGPTCAHSTANASSDATEHRRLASAPAAVNGTEADLTYFVSVRCSDASPASFKLIASAIQSHLVNGVSVHGELCPGGFIYHHWEHNHVNEKRSVRFHLTKHGGDGYFLVRHGASFDEAPMKLAPPYLHMGEHDEFQDIEYCNASDAFESNDRVFVMLIGGTHCMSYEIMAEEQPNSECEGMGHGDGVANAYINAEEIAPHHFVHGSCVNDDWVDFKFTLTAEDEHYNYLVEVEDLAESPDPTALALFLYNYEIPSDRRSEQRAETAIDGLLSLAINRHNFHNGTSYISLNCRGAGPTPRRFRLVLFQIEEFLTLDKEYHGEASPGQWVYHSYVVPEDGAAHNFTFHLIKHTGDLEIVTRHSVVPLKLIPPFSHMAEYDFEKDTQVCNSLPGEKVYIGMMGGKHAALYEIIASELPVGAPCVEPDHTAAPIDTGSVKMYELKDRVITLGHCEPEGWYDAYTDVMVENLGNNLVFELEELGMTGTLDAVSVYMWADAIPKSRKSEYFTQRAYGGVYSLSVSMHEFEPFLEHGHASQHTIYFGVHCGARAARFRTFITFVHSHIDTGHMAHGEVCPNEWVYHKLDIDDALLYGTASSAADAHRRLAAIGVGAGGEIEQTYAEPLDERSAAAVSRRALATNEEDEVEDTPGVHVRMHIIKNIGAMNLMVSLNDKPLRLIPSDTTYMEAGDAIADIILCNVEKYYRNVSTYDDGKMKYYLGISGGNTCAHYEIETSTFTSSCAEAKSNAVLPAVHEDEAHGSAGARECRHGDVDCVLSMRHYMRSSCSPHERAPPFVVKLPYTTGEPLDNLVMEVEDLNTEENPNSLEVALYQGPNADGACPGTSGGSCTHEQLGMIKPLRTTSDSRARIFSFGISSIEMQKLVCDGACKSSGTFSLNMVVRCKSTAVRFQVISILTQLILVPNIPVHGEVCPGNWIYHKTFIPDNTLYHNADGVRFNVHVHQGDVYYMVSRWTHSPGFAACNENEVSMSFKVHGHADLCHLTEKFESTYTAEEIAAAAANGTEKSLIGYVGLYGGTSCAHYTIETERLVNKTCHTETTGTCRTSK